MKLGKKQKNDTPKQIKSETSTTSKTSKLKQLTGVAALQVLVVVIAGVVAVALMLVLVVQPATEHLQQQQARKTVEQARTRIEQQLVLLQDMVTGLAAQDYVRDTLKDPDLRADVEANLKRMLPGIAQVSLFPYGDVPRSAGNVSGLGFASLDLLRRAESGRQVHADAFPRDGNWFVQMAAPVRNPTSKATAGSVLIVLNESFLTRLLADGDTGAGKLALVQTVSGQASTVVSQGAGKGTPVEVKLTTPGWTLHYTPAITATPVISSLWMFALIMIPAVLAAGIVAVVLVGAQNSLRKEVTALIQWAHKAFSGERAKLPELGWDMLATMGETLQRLAQVSEKRIEKVTSAARTTAKAPVANAGDVDEPMFQNNDMLDIDMLDGDDDVLGLDGAPAQTGMTDLPIVENRAIAAIGVSADIFRAYDIRGIVDETLTSETVEVIGRALGSEAIARGLTTLCVGWDGRHSSPQLATALSRGLMATGCNVIKVGAVPTPVLYFATHHLETGSGVMVTGSHNPSNYNGLKMMLGGETLSGDAIQLLLQRIQAQDFVSGQGSVSEADVRRDYLDRIISDIAVAAPLKVVLDAGNGIAGELGPILIEELGCEVIPLFCDVDGDFPNHHPDPGKPENLEALIAAVKEHNADLGLAFDGDGDRLGVVTNTGKIIWPDRLMMLFARDVVSRNPGADVIYDVKCSRRLAGVINEAGGRPIMWKTGHSLMKAKMRETGALLAGEMSGHVFFKERWYGFDDGLYSAARLLEILGIEDRHSDEVFEDFPEDISTPELNVDVTEATKFGLVEQLVAQGNFGEGNVTTIDGIRVDYPDGWGLCRASNTTPVLVLRFEAETEEALERIKSVFRAELSKVAPDIVVNF